MLGTLKCRCGQQVLQKDLLHRVLALLIVFQIGKSDAVNDGLILVVLFFKFPDIHPITLLHGFTLYSWRGVMVNFFHKIFCQQNFRIRLYFGFIRVMIKKIQDIFQTVFNPKGAYHHDYPGNEAP